ncbi:hypothetical protein [Streptomyces alanosinicus]|uniref:Uncharacterized protein n=1 Tax=Streptomyces alanosinicus TaxID=68171 RepID=A0A919D4B3_9ACTN|nr:hypothetical protein [Streptomyces alanosinicus]GHE07339.1 hypothetical protein GCM10010339_52040 [Streptomyces alanosinicus]
MSNAGGADMTAWVGLAVSAVGPTGDRPYDAWLAQVERTAVDLWLMSAPGGSTARLAQALSSCSAVTGILTQAHLDGGRTRARLVVRIPGGEHGAEQEHTFHTEELVHARARDVLDRAQPLIGHGVRLLLAVGGSGAQRVLHISDSGERDRTSVEVRGAQGRTAPSSMNPAPAEVQSAASVPAATDPVAAPAPVAPMAPQPPVAPPVAPSPVAPPAVPPPLTKVPDPEPPGAVSWEEGSVSVWRSINRGWPKEYRTSCLLWLRERVQVDDRGLVLNLDQLIDMAEQLPDPDTPRGKDIASRHPA